MEFLRLLGLNILVSLKNIAEFCRIVKRYYPNKGFRRADLAVLRKYLFNNPFRISKRFLSEQGVEDPYTYGETPLTTMELIADECAISAGDVVFELGCGRGRTCFWLAFFKNCRAVGIEYIPEFVDIAQRVKALYEIPEVDFIQEDMLQTDLTTATVVYLYGTCYSEAFISALIKKFEKLPKGTRIITVSYSLQEFKSEEFAVVRCFPASFTWGEADVYLQVRR